MNLITLPELTPAEHALVTMQQLRNEGLEELARKTKRAFDLMWRNDRASPGEMADALGTNAKAVFDDHAATVAYLLARDPSLLSPADYTPPQAYTFHEDGSLILF